MHNLLEDIKSALEAKLYRPALALALTVPDICGLIAYPELSGNRNTGKRYVMWFDEYVTKDNYPEDFEDKLKFDGKMCYRLRCSVLHSGDLDVPIDEFELTASHTDFNMIFGGSVYETSQGYSYYSDGTTKEHEKKYRISLNIGDLCMKIYYGAKYFYETIEDKQTVDSHSIPIFNIDDYLERRNQIQKRLTRIGVNDDDR